MDVSVDGVATHVYTGGRAWRANEAGSARLDPKPVILFVHGAAHDHSIFALQSRYFAHHGHDVLVPDLPGHGRSCGTPSADIESLAAWLVRLLDATGVARCAIVGHSMGALAALELAARAPERVTRLALLGPAVPMTVSEALLDAAARDEPAAHAMITAWSHGPRGLLGGNRQPGMWLAGQTRTLLSHARRGVLHADLLACQSYTRGLDAARQVRCPTLLVQGARDLMAPARNAAPLASALANVRTVTLADTGHAMMIESPDALLDALRHFLA
jgi:pimeloyl-ACP methyl ester carboxylesterase